MSISEFQLTESVQETYLDGAIGVEIITIDERTFVYTGAFNDDLIVIHELFADGNLAEIGTVPNAAGLGLDGVHGFASTTIGGRTFLYASGEYDDAVTIFEVGADGSLTALGLVEDSDVAAYEFDRPAGNLTIATVGTDEFLIVTGQYDNGISVFQIGSDGLLTNTDNIDDAPVPGYTLDGVRDTSFARHNGTSFVFAVGQDEDGITVFSLSSGGQLTLLSSLADDFTMNLNGATSVETAVIDGTLHVFVGGRYDDGISVFSVDADGILTNVFNIEDTADLALNGVHDMHILEFGGSQFLAASGIDDDGLTLFSIGSDGSLTPIDSVFDSDGAQFLLDGAAYLDTVEIDGQVLLLASGHNDDALSVFQLNPDDAPLDGTTGNDILVGTDRGEEINGLQGDDIIVANSGDDTIDAGEGSDLVTGGDGNDRINGDGDLTQSASDVVTVTETGQDLALTLTLPDSSNGESIEISGIVNRVPGFGGEYNIVYVIDNSGSMDNAFTGTETVPDLNNDGYSNTLIDGTIAAFQSLNDSLIAAGFSNSDVGIVGFDSSAWTIFNGSALGGVNDALASMEGSGDTNFEAALSQAISVLQGMGSGQNIVYFISDGDPTTGGAYTDEVATLTDAAGLNAVVTAFGLGSSADMAELDFVDDGIDNDSALQVLEPSSLTAGLTGSPVDTAEVDRLEIRVNGVLVRSVDGSSFASTPLGLRYDAVIDGLSTNAGDTIEVTLVASDSAETAVNVSLDVPNANLEVGDDTLIGGAGMDTLNGNGGNDVLLGESDGDLIVGGTGDDLLDGGSGDDSLFGDSGNDTLIGGSGADLLQGGVGDDVYYIDGDDIVDEGTGATGDFDTIVTRVTTDLTTLNSSFIGSFEAIRLTGNIDATARGDDGDNLLHGNSGENLLVGRDGADTLYGGAGADLMAGGNGNDSMLGEEGDDTLYGNDDNDTLRGREGNDDLFGGNGSDSLNGGDGNDSMEGGNGADTLVGGDGNDRINGGGNHDTHYGNDGDDTIVGETGHDYISGGDGADVLSGREHDDTIYGGNGDDRIYGGEDEDLLAGNDGDDEMYGGTQNDRMFGGGGNDTLEGEGGADEISGGADDDRIDGGGNHDTLSGDGGNDTIFGDTGNDLMDGGDGDDTMRGDEGQDTLRGGEGHDVIYGSHGQDLVVGNDGDDDLNGGSQRDRLFGGNGNDTLSGDEGSDTLDGGDGADVFVFEGIDDSPHTTNRDVISDFEHGVDTIDLSGFSGTLSFVGSYTGTAGEVRYNDAIGRLYIDVDGDSASDFSVDLTGTPVVDASDLIL